MNNPTRWSTGTAGLTPSRPFQVEVPQTPTPSRRSNAHLASTVFGHSSAQPPFTWSSISEGNSSSFKPASDRWCGTKQTSIEWSIFGVRDLKDHIEHGDSDDDCKYEILATEGRYFEDFGYKIHLERSPEHVDEDEERNLQSTEPILLEPTLSLAIISEYTKHPDLPEDEAFKRYVFVGIKPYEPIWERGFGEPVWLWVASSPVVFSKRQQYWDVTLPPLKTLVDLPQVTEHDAFAIRIVVKREPTGVPPLVHDDQQFISRRVTRQCNSLLDSVRTGDVRFLCLEHSEETSPNDDKGTAIAPVTRPLARRRALYAHSEILVHTDYFKAALSGGFAEGLEGTMTTLIIDDAAFNTVYWVLRWLYTDEISFSASINVRSVMTHINVDKATTRRLLSLEGWSYATYDEDIDEETKTAHSSSSVGTTASGRHSPTIRSTTIPSAASTNRSLPSSATRNPVRTKSLSPGISATALPGSVVPPVQAVPSLKTGPPRKPGQVSAKSPGPSTSTSRAPSYAASTPRRGPAPPPVDPHEHPTLPPTAPSPLAVFFLAHRYGLDDLQALARDALLRHLTPHTCISALLATYSFGDLHAAIMDYVTDHWTEVCVSPELARCYQEVSAGVWGEHEGGLVLLGLTRRLSGV